MSKKTKLQKIKTTAKRESGQIQYSLPTSLTPITEHTHTHNALSKDEEIILQATKKDIIVTAILAIIAIVLLFILSRII